MSIIHDALKKAQVNLDKMTSKGSSKSKNKKSLDSNQADILKPYSNASSQERNNQIIYKNQNAPNSLTYFIIYASVFTIIVLLISNFYISKLKFTITQETPKSQITYNKNNLIIEKEKDIDKSILGRETAVVDNTKDDSKQGLSLTGTMMMGDKRVAIIDDEVYEIGEFIDDMKITDISLEKVDLMKDGKITSLHVRRKKKR